MSAPARVRLLWADTAKGGCILLVVLWHVTKKDYLDLPWHVPLHATGVWGMWSEVLLPVRMPLFFLISGMFAVRQLDRPWRQVLTGRVAPLLFVYVLWTLVQTVLLREIAPDFDTAVAHGPLDLLVQLTVTPGNLWYLGALAAYVAVARATRAAPHLTLTAALLVSAVAAAGWVPTPGNRYGLLTNLVWFLLGTQVTQLRPPGRRLLLTLTVAFVVAAALWQLLDADEWFGVRPLLGLLGIAAGVTAATALARVPRLGPALASLGQRTLPIYVLHLPLVALAHLVAVRVVGGRVASSLPVAAVYPAAVTAAVVALCLLLHRALLRVGAGWLFTAPWLRRTATVQPPEPLRRRLPT